jgi:hypothetical protein
MMVKDSMFGFEIKVKSFSFNMKRPKPPAGYIQYKKANCQSGKCPNCGHEKPGTVGGHKNADGFQDRDVQNVLKAMQRLVRRLPEDKWKPFYVLFSIDLDPTKEKYATMLKCHPSRFGRGKFYCCEAEIWHDFFDGGWDYYYKPTNKNKNTLDAWFKLHTPSLK